MTAQVRFGTSGRNARATAIRDLIDAGSGPGTLKIYAGTVPATGAAITTQTLLGTCTFSDPCGTVTNGVLTFSAITGGTAVATGTATFARALDSTGTFVADLDAGVTGSGSAIELSTVGIVIGAVLSVTSGTITEANI